MPSNAIELIADGQVFSSWKEATLTRAIEAAAGSFALSVSDRTGFPIKRGAKIEMRVDGEPMLLGYVDKLKIEVSKSSHSIMLEGRDLTAELVDCSAVNDPGEWYDVKLDELAQFVAAPFGVTVRAIADVGDPFQVASVKPAEGAFEFIERHCRMRGMLAYPSRAGELLLARPATERERYGLREGYNLEAFSASFDDTARFRSYIVHAQRKGSDEAWADECAFLEGTAEDTAVRSLRALRILAENVGDSDAAERRAQWEATVRAARAGSFTALLTSFRQRIDGPLWDINQLVPVDIPTLRLSGELLIVGVKYEFNPQAGLTCELAMSRPTAFEPVKTLTQDDDKGADWGSDVEGDEEAEGGEGDTEGETGF